MLKKKHKYNIILKNIHLGDKMSIVDLNRRITHDWDVYSRNLKSHESYIYLMDEGEYIQAGTSITITVGPIWYDVKKNTDIKITDKGIKIKAQKYVVLQSQQSFALPYNIYGIVVGKGVNIFSGGVISTGKIIPGYRGTLRIGYFNASNRTIILRKGDVLGSAIFFDTEATAINPKYEGGFGSVPALEALTRRAKIIEWICDNWYNILTLVLSVVAIIVALIK